MEFLENCNIEKLLLQDKTTETMRIGTNIFINIDEYINKRVNCYFVINCGTKINYQEFIKTNDYYIQRTQI
jgi:hypothetical protein